MGGSRAHEFMVAQRLRRGHARPVRRLRLRDNRQIAPVVARTSPPRRTSCRSRRSRRPTRPRSRRSRTFLGVPKSDREGRVLRHRRRPVRRRHRARRLRRQRDEAREPRQGGRGLRPRHGRRDQGARHGGGLRLADRRPGRDRRRRRAGRPSPNLVAGANRAGWHVRNVNVPRDYTPDVIADITNVREGDPCPNVRRDRDPAQRDRGRQHLQARHELHDGARRRVPGRGRRAPPDRHGLVRDRARAQRRVHRRGAPRREGHRLARRGRAVPRAPRRDRRQQGPAA